jgi:large subunit ribosomal protein L13
MKTKSISGSEIERNWHLIDGEGKILGRLATEAAVLLRGKHKVKFTPNTDNGDFVVIINAAKIQVTGKKTKQKHYFRHSVYPGGVSNVSLAKTMQIHPTRAIEHAVEGMLPRTHMGSAIIRRLKVYAGAEHPHQAQFKSATKAEKKES